MPDVFSAIGDSTRRRLLDRLRSGGPLSLTDLARDVPMTRQAVTKHLDILEDAGLIERHPQGRERMHVLNGRVLKELSDWLAPYEAAWDERLRRLEQHLNQDADNADEE